VIFSPRDGQAVQVTYKDLEGVFQSVEVTAESVYEASVLALSALSKHEWIENVGPGKSSLVANGTVPGCPKPTDCRDSQPSRASPTEFGRNSVLR
jgi:hypothetical protein